MKETWMRKFALIWAGQFISLISSSAVNFAIIIWLSIETGSAETLAFAAIAALLPQAIIGPFAGVYIDRWDRKKTMIFSDAFVALCTAFMALNFYMGNQSLFFIYIMLGLRSVGSAFHMPAMQAAIPMLAPKDQLLRIAGINQIIQSVSSIAGPALGALLIGLFSIGNVLLFDIIGAVFAITSLLFVYIPNPEKAPDDDSSKLAKVWKDLRIGIVEVFRDKGITWMFIYSIIATFCILPVSVLFPLLTLNHFNGGKFEMSIIEIVWGVGMLIGGGLIGIIKPTVRKIIFINIMHIVLGLTFTISGILPTDAFILFTMLTVIGGAAASIYNANFVAIIQEEIDPSKMGRVFSMFYSIAIIPSMIGLLSTGFVADNIGVNLTFIILGAVISFVGIISFFTPSLMQLGKK